MSSAAVLLAIAVQLGPAGAGLAMSERLTLIGPDREIVAVLDGEAGRVVLTADIDRILLRAGASITLVHDHVIGLGLSASDLEQLAKPGVARIVAAAFDGSRYDATRGRRFNVDAFEAAQYRVAHDEVIRLVRIARSGREMPRVDDYIAHVISLALHKAAAIVSYTATFAPERSTIWDRYRPVLGPIAEAAASRVREHQAASTR